MDRIDHLGIAVKSIEAAKKLYESLGMRVEHEETVAGEQVHTAMIPVGGSRIELLEAASADSVIGRFIAKRGEGLHHVAVHVDDIASRLRQLKAKGVRLVNDEIKIGAGGHLYFFVHPESTGGVLLEICQDPVRGV